MSYFEQNKPYNVRELAIFDVAATETQGELAAHYFSMFFAKTRE